MQYTKLLLHFDGADGATSDIDYSGQNHIFTFNGNAQLDTAQYKFGPSSLLLDGTGDYIDTPDNIDWGMGSGDFTVDMWIRTTGNSMHTCGQLTVGGTNVAFYLYIDGAGNVVFYIDDGGANSVTSTTAVNDGTWHHIAGVRSGNTMTLYIDGTSEGTPVGGLGTIPDRTTNFSIGRNGEFDGAYFAGWIDEFRISKGVARWTANFTPPGGPYGAISELVDSYVKLLLPFDGVDGATSTIDLSGNNHVFAFHGNAQIDTAVYKYAPSSLLLDGTGDYIDIADHADWYFGSGDFTMELWLKRVGTGVEYFAGQVDNTASNGGFYFYFQGDDTIRFVMFNTDPAANAVTSTGTITDTNWHHIAAVRDGNTLRLFIDGIADGTVDVTGKTHRNSIYDLGIGRLGEFADDPFEGHIAEFRISKGIARWTSNFTPNPYPYHRIAKPQVF